MAILLIFGGAIFGVLGALHAVYTLLDLRNPRRLVPSDPSVAQAMANSGLRLSGGRTDMWRAWIGFNFSHSLGVLLVGALGVWAGYRIKVLPVDIIMPALTLIGCGFISEPEILRDTLSRPAENDLKSAKHFEKMPHAASQSGWRPTQSQHRIRGDGCAHHLVDCRTLRFCATHSVGVFVNEFKSALEMREDSGGCGKWRGGRDQFGM